MLDILLLVMGACQVRNVSKTVAGGGPFYLFGLKSPCLKGVLQHVHGLQCRSSDCNFRLEQFVWNNGTKGICPTPRFGDGVHARCSMGPSRSLALERVFFSLKSLCRRGLSGTILASNVTQMTVMFIFNDSYGSMGPTCHVRHLDLAIGAMSSP